MTYATKTNLIERFGLQELLLAADLADPPNEQVDDVQVDNALADADAEINSYLAARMTTPVSPVPRILIRHACAMARYYLWKDRASERVRSDYDDAIAWLKLAAAGQVSLGDDAAATEPASAGKPAIVAPKRHFTRKTLREF